MMQLSTEIVKAGYIFFCECRRRPIRC